MTATEFDPILALDNPYPGLRSFEAHESLLFFGREEHTKELLDRLALNRFLAVIGTSGSGKSSLVRAGLLPVLYRGYLAGTGSRWRIAIMRPGSAPLHAMTLALAGQDALAFPDTSALRKTLESSSYGLVNALRAAKLRNGESLLLVVDQFEELFRFAQDVRHPGTGAEATLFVSLLIQAAEEFNEPIYIVLTMRSEFLGHCTRFPGLAEALNRSQYLVPRLTLDQRQAAIERPLALKGAEITPRLVQRLLGDAGDDPDQLPVLQHALMRTYRHWEACHQGQNCPLDLPDYEDMSKSGSALDQHAQELFESLPGTTQQWAERLFRCLTTTIDGQAVRRHGRLCSIYDVTGANTQAEQNEIDTVVRLYAARENSLLFCTTGGELTPESVIDIAHESLIRKWTLLGRWVSAEAKNAGWYRDVAGSVARGAALMESSDLAHFEQLAADNRWNPFWAAQYPAESEAPFSRVKEYLQASRQAQQERDGKEEERRNRELRTAQELARGEQKRKLLEQRRRLAYLLMGLMALVVIGLAGLARSFYQQVEAANQANKEMVLAREAEIHAQAEQNLAKAQSVELQLLRATGAAREQLQKELDGFKDKAAKLEQQAKGASNVKADPNDAATERIRKLQDEVTSLQERLRQRDLLLYQKSDSPQQQQQQQQQQQRNEAETIAGLRKQIQGLQTEITRLREPAPPVTTTDSVPTFHPLIIPQKSWQVHRTADLHFGVLLEDLSDDASATARMFVFKLPNALAPAAGAPVGDVKKRMDELVRTHPCPSPQGLGGDVLCFVVDKKRTNTFTQPLGTVLLGQTAVAFTAMGWTNIRGGTDFLSLAVVAAGKARPPAISRVEPVATADWTSSARVLALASTSLGAAGGNSFLYFADLSVREVLTVHVMSTQTPWWPPGGKPRSADEVRAKLDPTSVPRVTNETYYACTIRKNETCWVTLPSGQLVGLQAADLDYGRTKVNLIVFRSHP